MKTERKPFACVGNHKQNKPEVSGNHAAGLKRAWNVLLFSGRKIKLAKNRKVLQIKSEEPVYVKTNSCEKQMSLRDVMYCGN